MKKNADYIGVDDKYVPEEEKYVDNTANNEVKEEINKGIHVAKEFINNTENKEKIKTGAKKGFKILKGVGIGYITFLGFIFLMVIVVFIVGISSFISMRNRINDFEMPVQQVEDISVTKTKFNNTLMEYIGENHGGQIESLLTMVNRNTENYPGHLVTVVYKDTSVSYSTDIIALKKEFKMSLDYEVSFEYDNDGFINKINIKDLES